MKRFIVFFAIIFWVNSSIGQINDNGSVDGPMTTAQIQGTVTTLVGLTIYSTDTNTDWQWDGSAWVDTGSGGGGSGDLLSTNNLSDVTNAAISAQNLNLEVGVDVQAYSLNLDAITAQHITDLNNLSGVNSGNQDASQVALAAAVNGETDVQSSLEDHETRIDGLAIGGDGVVTNVTVNGNNLDFTGTGAGFNGSTDISTTTAVAANTAKDTYPLVDSNKLAGIEPLATADQNNAEIETAYNTQVPQASQSEMEIGTVTSIRRMTPEGVAQAIAALGSSVTETSTNVLTNKTLDSFTNEVAADEVHEQVRNLSGAPLVIGTPVYVSGYNVGQSLSEVAAADATNAATMPAIGIVGHADILNSTNGEIVISGRVENFDTSAYAVGNDLYVSETTGQLTNVIPIGSALIQKMASVLRSHATLGVITVTGTGRSNQIPNFTAEDKLWVGGLNGVSMESDISDLPISTAQQTALDLKADDSNVMKLSGTNVALGTSNFAGDGISLDNSPLRIGGTSGEDDIWVVRNNNTTDDFDFNHVATSPTETLRFSIPNDGIATLPTHATTKADLDLKANDVNVLHTTGNETKTGDLNVNNLYSNGNGVGNLGVAGQGSFDNAYLNILNTHDVRNLILNRAVEFPEALRLNPYDKSLITTPLKGSLVSDTTEDDLMYYDGSAWVNITGGGVGGNFQENLNIVNAIEGGMATDGSDQSTEFLALIADNTHIFLPSGRFDFTAIMDLPSVSNLVIDGSLMGTTELVTSEEKIFNVIGDLTNVKFRNITFDSEDTLPITANGIYSLFHSNGNNIDGLYFDNVTFTAPDGVAANGIHLINEGVEIAQNIWVMNSTFNGIGQMGVELQNHNPAVELIRFQNIYFINNVFKNTGLTGEPSRGMGISISGRSDNVNILNNEFENNPNRDIEYVAGVTNSLIDGNISKGSYSSIVVTENTANSLVRNKNITVKNHIIENPVTDGQDLFKYVDNLTIDNYNYTSTDGGTVVFENVINSTGSSINIDTDAYAGIIIRDMVQMKFNNGFIKNSRIGNSMIRVENANLQARAKFSNFELYKDVGVDAFTHTGGSTVDPIFHESNLYAVDGTFRESLESSLLDNLADVDITGKADNSILKWNTANSQWEMGTDTGAGGSDVDWYETGTTTAPDAITDNIFKNGKVSIGGDVQNYSLNITDPGATPIYLQFTNSATGFTANDGFFFGPDGSGAADIYQAENQPMRFWTNNLQRMIIEAGGDVGIGIANPTEKLEVVGTVKATAFEGDGSALTNLPGSSDNSLSEANQTIAVNRTVDMNSGIDFSFTENGTTNMIIASNVDFPDAVEIPTIQGTATAPKHAVNKETMDAATSHQKKYETQIADFDILATDIVSVDNKKVIIDVAGTTTAVGTVIDANLNVGDVIVAETNSKTSTLEIIPDTWDFTWEFQTVGHNAIRLTGDIKQAAGIVTPHGTISWHGSFEGYVYSTETLGPELITTNADFSNGLTDWVGQGDTTESGGVVTIIGAGPMTNTGSNNRLRRDNVVNVGVATNYKMVFDARRTVGSGFLDAGQHLNGEDVTVTGTMATYTVYFTSNTGSPAHLGFGGVTSTDQFEIDNVSLKEVL